jgi:hypothetical protein
MEEQHCIVLYCGEKKINAKVLHKEMFPVYGGKYLSH